MTRFTPLTFSGTGLQLFGIQILNMFLTMLTLGLWTPWARVRKRRFFYSNTRILDEGLDYLATGFDIFKGWMIVTLIFAIYVIPILLPVPFLEYLLVLVLLFVYPWALNRSFRFNARNIVWRDVRFDFNGSYLGSLWYFFILPLIGLLSVGLLMPLASKAMRDYVARVLQLRNSQLFIWQFGAVLLRGGHQDTDPVRHPDESHSSPWSIWSSMILPCSMLPVD